MEHLPARRLRYRGLDCLRDSHAPFCVDFLFDCPERLMRHAKARGNHGEFRLQPRQFGFQIGDFRKPRFAPSLCRYKRSFC